MKTTGKKQAAIYCRTSVDDEEGESKSLPQQEADSRKLCESYGYEVFRVIREPNRSGRLYPDNSPQKPLDKATAEYVASFKHKNRPGLAELLSILPQVDVVVARDNERIARPVSGGMLSNWLTGEFRGAGVVVHTVTEGLQEPDNWNAQFIKTITEMAVDRENQKRKANSKAKLKVLRDSGLSYCGVKRFGYLPDGHQKQTIVEAEAKIIRQLFEALNNGESISSVHQKINSENPGRLWRRQQIRKWIDRPEYAGLQRNSEGKLIESKTFFPIVTREQWENAQKTRKHYIPGSSKYFHPLSGLVKCGFCGQNMLVQMVSDGSHKWYYKCLCSSSLKNGENRIGCGMSAVREEELIRLCLSFSPLLYANKQKGMTEAEKQEQITKLQEQKIKQQKRQDELVSSSLPISAIEKQVAKLEEEIQAVEEQIKGLNRIVAEKEKQTFKQISQAIFRTPWNELREPLTELIEYVRCFAFEIEIKLKGRGAFRLLRVQNKNKREIPAPVLAFQGLDIKEVLPFNIYFPYQTALTTEEVKPEVVHPNLISLNCKQIITPCPVILNTEEKAIIYHDAEVIIWSLGKNYDRGERAKLKSRKVKKLPSYVLNSEPLPGAVTE